MFFGTILPVTSRVTVMDGVLHGHCTLFRNSHTLAGRFTIDDIDRCLNEWSGFLNTFAFAVSDGTIADIPEQHNRARSQKQQLDICFRGGSTITLNGLELRHALLGEVCRDAEIEIGGHASAAAFLTPPKGSSLKPRFSAGCKFVVQLEGKKHWTTWNPLIDAPTEDLVRPTEPEELGAPSAEFTLAPGDVLFIGSGAPHQAYCTDWHSLHVTVTVDFWRAHQIAEFLIRTMASGNETARQHILAASVDSDSEARLKVALLDIASALERANTKALLETYKQAISAKSVSNRDRSLRNAFMEGPLSVQSVFKFDSKALHSISIDDLTQRVVIRLGCASSHLIPLHFRPPHIQLPLYTEPEIQSIFSKSEPFTASDLQGNLDLPSRVVLLRKLAKHGVVTILQV